MIRRLRHFRFIAAIGTSVMGGLCLFLVTYALIGYEDIPSLSGRLLAPHIRGETPWKTLRPEDISRGITAPAHTNVLLQIPERAPRIERRVLLGGRGEMVRYWGYCFPLVPQVVARRSNRFPGKLFLSEAERESREAIAIEKQRKSFSPFKTIKDEQLALDPIRGDNRIRHQMEYFEGGTTCYLMTEQPLPIGIDSDGDLANSYVERSFNSDPLSPDTDGDGVSDGLEIFELGSSPLRRDSDGDGLIDGIEDMNHNGKLDYGETDVTNMDSDHDGLCDGLCLVNSGQELRGEDKNLNGVVDEGETNPTMSDTDGDGILDEQEYFNCLLTGGLDC
jgi:hypothetical protein